MIVICAALGLSLHVIMSSDPSSDPIKPHLAAEASSVEGSPPDRVDASLDVAATALTGAIW